VGLHISNDCTGVSGGTGGGDGGSGTGTGSAQSCAQLKSCCTVGMFPEAALTANCPTVYNSGSSALCANLLSTYVTAGYCAADGGA
jgi:hypothetical protein